MKYIKLHCKKKPYKKIHAIYSYLKVAAVFNKNQRPATDACTPRAVINSAFLARRKKMPPFVV
jgi:hypothetical protein